MLAKVYPLPPPISLLSKISLIKDYNSYFSHTARIGREYRLCAFFTLHRLRKPQGTQGVELRSTSQRNNRNVLMDWDNSIQNKFPRNLKPAGFPKGCPLWQTEKEGGVWGGRFCQRSFEANLFCRGVLPPQKQLGV